MSEKSMEQFLFEYEDPRGRTPDMTPTGEGPEGTAIDSFRSMKSSLGSYERMMAILAGEEKFEYDLLDNPKMVRALVDQVKQMIKNKEKLNLENKSINERIKELKRVQYKTPEERDELEKLLQKDKAFQLQKTLMRFENKLDELDDILSRIEDGVDLQDKTIKKYEDIVGELEDALFQETYVRPNLAYDRGEASGRMKKPTATENFPVMFRADNGKTYYGIVRPPSGIITWEGSEARNAWVNDADIKRVFGWVDKSRNYRKDDMLKLRISKDDFKVLKKEVLNNKLLNLNTTNGKKKLEYRDDDQAKEAVRNFILSGGKREVTDYNVMGSESPEGIEGGRTKTVNPSLDKQGRPKDLTSVIDSIEFWRFIRGLF